MKLIRLDDRIINLGNLDFAQHVICEDRTYVLLHFQGASRPLQLKDAAAEAIWQLLEEASCHNLLEQVEPTDPELAIAS